MKDKEKVSVENWKKLLKLAYKFKQLKPWEWMLDGDIFGVKNPLDNKTGYCCIMGRLGRFKGLSVYLGTEGLESYLKICSGEVEVGSFESLLNEKCLMLSYGELNELDIEDYDILKYSENNFSDKQLPIFRNHQTGYLPWIIDNKDAEYLIQVIEQVINVSVRCKKSKEILENKNDHFFVREKNGNNWSDNYLKPEEISQKNITPIIDYELLELVEKSGFQQESTWNIISINLPTAVQENEERPYYPYIFSISDEDLVNSIGFELCDYNKIYNRYPSAFLKIILEQQTIPKKISFFQSDIKNLLEPITNKLSIKVSLSKSINKAKPFIEEIVNIISSEN